MDSSNDLETELNRARKAEESSDFFGAAFLYKNSLEYALKLKRKEIVIICKNKIVEMNRKSIASGKDFKDLSFEQKIEGENKRKYEKIIKEFLSEKNLIRILEKIGRHPFLMPKLSNVKKVAKKPPLSYQIASLSSISDEGHILRGGSDGNYAWFMKMYDLQQRLIIDLYLTRIMTDLITNGRLQSQDLSDYFLNSGLIEQKNLKIILVGIKRYFEEDYISALHILVPQFESVFLNISEKLGIDIVALDQKHGLATRTKTLSESYLDSEEFKKVWGEDFCGQIKFVLFEAMGYKLRHKTAHGEITIEECNFQNTTLVLYLYLVLLGRVKVNNPKKSV
jgi:hypothetical protein